MRQKRLRSLKVTGAVYVDRARSCLDFLIRDESRGPGDTENAIRRIATRERLSFSNLWSLRYRPPKDVYASVLFGLTAAYDEMRERQFRALEAEVARDKAAGRRSPALDAAEALVREETDRRVLRGDGPQDQR